MQRFLMLVVILLGMVGCVAPTTTSTTTGVDVPPTAKKVGYLVNVRSHPTHTHIGTTALTNFTKQYPYNWEIPAYIERQLATRLERFAGVKAVNLREEGITAREIIGLVKNVNGVWMVARGKAGVYKNLADRLGLSAVIVINESPKQALKDCGILGCKTIKAEGYGLLSQSFVNSNRFYSATPFFAHLYRLKPLGALDDYLYKINQDTQMTLVATSLGSKVQPNKIDFLYPKKFNAWTEAELRPFKAPLLKYIDNMTQLIADVVRDKVD